MFCWLKFLEAASVDLLAALNGGSAGASPSRFLPYRDGPQQKEKSGMSRLLISAPSQ
jgi:hypothetical protein